MEKSERYLSVNDSDETRQAGSISFTILLALLMSPTASIHSRQRCYAAGGEMSGGGQSQCRRNCNKSVIPYMIMKQRVGGFNLNDV